MTDQLQPSRGRFISLEGIEGVGKSTQATFIAAWLRERSFEVVETREPGGTVLAEKIRSLLLGENIETPVAKAELLLMFAARAQHLEKVIQPALAKGHWVICDRFTDATLAYQGGGRGISTLLIREIAEWCHPETWPDLTLLFDMAPGASVDRRRRREQSDRFESEKLAFFERVRSAYLELAEAEPDRIRVIDASPSREFVSESLARILEEFLVSELTT